MHKLTSQEEEAMRAIWAEQGGFISELLERMPQPQPPHTTLASTLKNLEKKGYVTAQKLGNSFYYRPLIDQQAYKKERMTEFVGHYFNHSFRDMVAFFTTQQQISPQDLQEIIHLIESGEDH
ncbi:BlaI/MecI/CopY family transcriptional regulator [Spirosoma validum]|uniref:BlaI/MecI/CopY family transcriptional regulator n=1 Tax=Spirosoma validum TaxID=2771355 RepID=A0A927BA27_9BACT|nr:BlaI/MecI/CopY family transcriptional regulator [Spirosoma validum]MBD2757887.1 BlaI/MecI/CopY family transcriptional regulator [Spirosoma validum]